MSLVGLFVLAWLASRFGTGTLVAGFSAGAVLALVGEPRRLAQQLLGLADGFFVPLFFVTLGAELDARSLVSSPRNLVLAGALAGAALGGAPGRGGGASAAAGGGACWRTPSWACRRRWRRSAWNAAC